MVGNSTATVFLLAQNRLVREALTKVIDRKSDISVVGSEPLSATTTADVIAAAPDVLVVDSYSHERAIPTSCEKIKRTQGPIREWCELSRQLEELRASMSVDGAAPVRAKIKEIVSEYSLPGPIAIHHEKQELAAAVGHD